MRAQRPPASITSRVVTGAGWMMGWRMVSRMLGFVSILVLAGLLQPADFGIVALAASVTAAVDGLSQLGVGDALVRLAEERRDYFDTAFTIQLARALLTGAAIALMGLFAADWLGEPRLQAVLFILAAVSVMSGFGNVGVVTISRNLDFRTQFLLQLGPRLLGFAVTTTLAFLLHSYWALIGGTVVSKLTSLGVSYAVAPHRPRFSVSGWRYLISFSFWTWATGIARAVWERSDPFLLGPVLGTATLGLYMLAGEIATLPATELIEPACSTLFPGFAMAQRNGSSPVAMSLPIAGALALCAIPFSIGVSACSGYLVTGLLGPQWQGARPVIAVLAWLCMFSPFSYVASSALSAEGRVARVFIVTALAAAFRVFVTLMLRHTGNLRLIAFAGTATVAVESIGFVWQLRAAGRPEIRELPGTMIRAALSVLLTCACLSALPGTWMEVSGPRIEALFAGGLIGVATFAIFGVCQGALWFAWGRPAGSERRLADLVRHDPRALALRARLFRPPSRVG